MLAPSTQYCLGKQKLRFLFKSPCNRDNNAYLSGLNLVKFVKNLSHYLRW